MIFLYELLYFLPVIILSTGILVTLTIDMFLPRAKKTVGWLSTFILLLTGYAALFQVNDFHILFQGMAATGGVINLLFFLYAFAGAIVALYSMDYLEKIETNYGEYYIVLLSAVLGMMLISSAKNLVMIFIGLEQMSLCFYILAGFRRKDRRSNEAAVKYFLLGSFATGFIVYGMALIYGASLTLSLDQIKMHIIELNTQPFFWIGILLFVIGFTFKIAAVPFHSWAPDVYQGAPTVVTAVMSSASKAAAFAALVIVLAPLNVYPASQKILVPFLSVIAVLSMIYGSIAALTQEDIKRLLAYSSIAHAGYILIGVASASSFGQGSVVFYLIVYTLMNLGAFGIISILENREGRYLLITDYEGFAVKSPVLAALLAIFMFSLSGLPPFAGFSAKYFVFMAAVKANLTWLAILGAIASAISVYFYLRVITVMYFKTGVKEHQFVFSKPAFLGIMITLVLFLAISIYPSSIFNALFTN